MNSPTPMTFASHDFQPRYFALVPCAGIGERAGAGGPKQYVDLAGQSVVAFTLEALAKVQRLMAILVVVSPSDDVFTSHAPHFKGERAWFSQIGGATRAESVLNGLIELQDRGAQPHDWVLVHDAARCLIRPEWVNRLIEACQDDEVGGLLALPLADTLKACESGLSGEPRIQGTIDRRDKWVAQTPQMFRLGLLRLALTTALSDPASAAAVTDEASAVEALGHQPRLVSGDFENFKLTWPADFALAERLLQTR